MMRQNRRFGLDMIFTLALFGVFVVTAVMVIMIGVHSYKSIRADVNETYDIRTSLAYIEEKVRRTDGDGAIMVEEIKDSDSDRTAKALVIRQTLNDTEYATYIYADEGKLKELFTRCDIPLQFKAGTALTEVSSFEISTVDEAAGLYKISLQVGEGDSEELYIHPQSESGVVS